LTTLQNKLTASQKLHLESHRLLNDTVSTAKIIVHKFRCDGYE